ncbi:DUF4231 domain-containing protein [Streptomyces sp. NPDC005568]|uniref:DUF4231 domain-containing protein n=1 Tax=Streptomyces sp. NPDC005568 TaxID=3156887 RepID=UPI0033BF3187
MGDGTPVPSTTLSAGDLPPLFHESDRQALSRQSESFLAVRAQLVVLLLATCAATLAEHVDDHAVAALAAVLYALTIVIGVHASRRRARAHWQAHRAVAETVKSLAWQYMVHGGRLAVPPGRDVEVAGVQHRVEGAVAQRLDVTRAGLQSTVDLPGVAGSELGVQRTRDVLTSRVPRRHRHALPYREKPTPVNTGLVPVSAQRIRPWLPRL